MIMHSSGRLDHHVQFLKLLNKIFPWLERNLSLTFDANITGIGGIGEEVRERRQTG